ncbi:hypothetical protein OG548_08095 [Streptomyces sp. NBC_01356]|uniref:hypothetical protein n=1 Tax=Streptomyces sp. NBC_01356 TaxID=2903836 RepID=UPI002E361BB6|nr:hypothetical protein [Streptomyces sp. NBC_01356]
MATSGLTHTMTGGYGPVESHRCSTFGPDNPLELSFVHGGWLGDSALATCAGCRHQMEMVWEATGETHWVNRSGEPAKIIVGLCAHCWSELLRD